MRADRLIAELMLLQVHGKMSASALAREMEVSPRTIYRDMLALNTAGIPVFAENGSQGGYQLVDGYRTQLTGFSTGELQALFAMNIPAILGELGMDADGKNALRKLQASLSQAQSHEGNFVAQRFLFDPSHSETIFTAPDSRSVLENLQHAIWNDHTADIQIQYMFRPGKINLTIAPYALVLKENRWYLVYQRSQSYRILTLAEITKVKVLTERFERDERFELSSVWANWIRYQQDQAHHYPVTLQVKDNAMPGFTSYLGRNIIHVHPENNSWQQVDCAFDRLEDARHKLLPLGGAIRILAPKPLRLTMMDYAAQFLNENQE